MSVIVGTHTRPVDRCYDEDQIRGLLAEDPFWRAAFAEYAKDARGEVPTS